MSLKATEIVKGLLYQRANMNRQEKEKKLELLQELRIDLIICLWRQPDPDLSKTYGMRYIHMEVPDGKSVDERIPRLALKVAALIRDRRVRVLAYCQGGKNRSGLFNALIVRQLFNLTGEQAFKFARERRPGTMGSNPAFVNYLTGLPKPSDEILEG